LVSADRRETERKQQGLRGMHIRKLVTQGALALSITATAAFAAQAQTVLNMGASGEPDTLDPHFASGTWENRVIGDMFIGLLTEAADGTAIPGAATDWTISDDGLVYTFDLRDDAVWSDGEPVTADDFVFSLQRILTPETAAQYSFLLYPIANAVEVNAGDMEPSELGVRAVDDDTLEITLAQPTPFFLELLTHYTAWPVPQHVVEEHGNAWIRAENIAVNGPYILDEWVPQTHVHLVRNDAFWDNDNVAVDEVYWYPTEDRAAAMRRFRAGELDANTDFASEQIEFLRAEMPDSYRIAPYLGIYYYPINSTDPALSDPNVRLALNLAINREAITDQVLRTGEIPAASFVPPIPGYEPATAPYADMSYDDALAEAQALMEGAGYGPDNRMSLVLRYNTSENHRRIAVAVSAMWQAIYIDTELFNTDVAVHYNDLEQADFQVARAGWIADYPDAQNFLNLLETAAGDFNYGRWQNEEYDNLMQEAMLTTDLEARAEIMRAAEQIALDDAANIPIYYYVSKNLVSPNIVGWVDNAKDIHRTRWLSLDNS